MGNPLQKIFITVPVAKCDSFISRYVNPPEGATREDTYDAKIVFLEKTQEVFTQGRIYGINNKADVAALSRYVGTLPIKDDGTAYNDIVDFINDSRQKAVSSITIGNNNTFAVDDTVYTLNIVNGQITLDPYRPLGIGDISLSNKANKVISNLNVEFDNEVTMEIANVIYSFTGTDNCKYMSMQLGSNWVMGSGTSQDKMEEVDLAPNTAFTKELTDEQKVTIKSSTGSAVMTVTIYAMDAKQTAPVKKEYTIGVTHQRAYAVGHIMPTQENFLIYNKRVLGHKPESISFDASTTHYGWFAFPEYWGMPAMKDSDTGLGMTMAENPDWDIIDMYSDNIKYKVLRTGQLCGNAQTIDLTW